MNADIDEGCIIRLETLLGAARLKALLGVLRQRLERLSEKAPALPDGALAFQFLVHQSRGSAASLGLIGLAGILDELEVVLLREGALDDDIWRERIFEQIVLSRDRFESGSRLIEARIKS